MPSPTFLQFAISISAVAAIHQGSLKIEVDNEDVDVHVVATSEKGQHFSTNDRAITLKWGGEMRGFLAKHESEEMLWQNYFNFTLLNKEISYDVDLSSVGCSCNAALFFVTMPGYNQNGTIARGNDSLPFYCDANQIGGVWCWEHDTIEGNMYNMATTPHTCNEAPGRYVDSCDKVGCAGKAFDVDPLGMCPGDICYIDTRKPFRIQQSYEANDEGKLVRIANRITQGERLFAWDACADTFYLEKMTAAFSTHMAMTFQLWGSSREKMKWLDEVTGCKGECIAEDTEATFSNIAIRPLASNVDVVVVV